MYYYGFLDLFLRASTRSISELELDKLSEREVNNIINLNLKRPSAEKERRCNTKSAKRTRESFILSYHQSPPEYFE